MKSFFRFFAKRHIIGILITTMILLMGVKSAINMNIDMFPSADFDTVIISTPYIGASSEDVERHITNLIEDALKGVSGLKEYTSASIEGASVITIIIDPDNTDKRKVKDNIKNAVNRINGFPSDLTDLPTVMEITSAEIPFIEVAIMGDVPYNDLRQQAKALQTKLENINGVARINAYGYRDREIQIEAFPDKLNDYQLSLSTIIHAIQTRNLRNSLGTIKEKNNEKTIITESELKHPERIKNMIIRSSFDGKKVRLSDIALVSDGFEEEQNKLRLNGKQAITFILTKKSSADVIKTAKNVKALVASENKQLNPTYTLSYARDMSKYVENRFNIVRTNGLIGLIFVLFVLSIFIQFRCGIWVAIGIPVSILGIFIFLPFFVPHLDIISMAGMIIVLGIIVDDAIIISENIIKHREEGADPIEAVVNGTSEVFLPVLTTILTTFIAFAPMFFMPGIIGKFIFVLPLVISLALFVSFIEVTIALPAHLVPILHRIKPGQQNKRQSTISRIKEKVRRVVRRLLNIKYKILVIYAAIFSASMLLAFTVMDIELFPSKIAEVITAQLEMPSKTSLSTTEEKAKEIEALLLTLPKSELDTVVTAVGFKANREGGGANVQNFASFYVNLTTYNKRHRIAATIANELREKTNKLTGIKSFKIDILQGGPPVGKALELKVISNNDTNRVLQTNIIETFLNNKDGVTDIVRNDVIGKDQVELVIDEDMLSRLGVSVASIINTVRIAFRGQIMTTSRFGDEDVGFRLILDKKSRASFKSLENLRIANNTNRLIRLKDIVTFKTKPGDPNYYHYDGKRTITIQSNVDKTRENAFEIYKELKKTFTLDTLLPDVRLAYGGESQETEESFQNLFKTFLVAIFGIYFILILLFNSFTQPFLVILAIPSGLAAVIFAFFLHGENLSFMAMLGTIGLVGVLVNDSLVLVSHINRLRKENPDTPLKDIVALGAANRFRAICITSLTTIAAVLPLAYGLGGTDPFVSAIGLALGYGLLFSTPFTLILVPCLYMINQDAHDKVEQLKVSWRKKKTGV